MNPRFELPPDAAQRYTQGASLQGLAAEYGTSPQTLGRRLVHAGVVLRGQAKTPQHRAKQSAAMSAPMNEVLLRQLASQNWTCSEMAPELGVSPECVRERMARLGIPRLAPKARPEKNYFWKGGRTQDKQGYILVKSPDHPNATAAGYVREHRLVMEAAIGRYLTPEEVVDHRNGNTSDNSLSNLRLFASNADHLRATLSGRVPNWTDDGRRRIREGVQKAADRRAANRKASENDDHP